MVSAGMEKYFIPGNLNEKRLPVGAALKGTGYLPAGPDAGSLIDPATDRI